MQEVGRLILNKNPEDYHRDVEQSAFSPGALVPGVEDAPDPLLQFRMFFYRDAQYHRLGSTNLHQIPVNCPFLAKSFSTPNIGGSMRTDGNAGGNPSYVPNSFTDKFKQGVVDTPYTVSDSIVSRQGHFWSEGKPGKDHEQATDLYLNIMTDSERQAVLTNTAEFLKFVEYPVIIEKYLGQLLAIDEGYAKGVWQLLPKEVRVPWENVKKAVKTAAVKGKSEQLMPHNLTDKLVGNVPTAPVYRN